MNKRGLPVIALACLVALGGCTDTSNVEGKPVPSAQETPAIQGATLRMSWPGNEDTAGLRGDIVTLTAFEGDTVDLALILEDADGNGIAGRKLWLVSTNGNAISTPVAPTDAKGRTKVSITADVLGQDVIHASGAGARKTLTLAVRALENNSQDNLTELSKTDSASPEPHNTPIVRSQKLMLSERKDVVPWKILADGVSLRLRDGVYKLMITDEIKALNGREVKLQGFMLPLEQQEKQKHFLLTASPPTCFFCLPGGAESIVEVKCDSPVQFRLEPIVMGGTLEVVENHDFGLVYRLTRASHIDK